MSSEKDLQQLLRLLTTTRKLPMLQAMAQVKALQTAGLKSVQQIADAPSDVVKAAIGDAAAAKSLQTSCKTASKRSARDEPAAAAASSPAKRARTTSALFGNGDGDELMTPAELEQSLSLPVIVPETDKDEARIADTVVLTNRAPLVLAFAVELLRYTMPEQPVSSRLSLAQAVVSANSRTKAASLGIGGASGPSADDEGWGTGQPRIRILGREIAVLKRSGYTWKGEEEVEAEVEAETKTNTETETKTETKTETAATTTQHYAGVWSVSQKITMKDSTFVARATTMTDAGQRANLMRALMERTPALMSASHNAWAYRVRGTASGSYAGSVRQDCFDDGETACGDLMLRVMTEAGAVDMLVVLTRWFGGTMLGPDRFRLMRNCVTGVLSERLRLSGAAVALSGEAAWGLDLEAMRGAATTARHDAGGSSARSSTLTSNVGMPIHRPEGARQYLLKSFPSYEPDGSTGDIETSYSKKKREKKRTLKAMDAEREENLARLLGALRIVYDSWADHISAAELDRRAWGWYVAVRPDVDAGPAGWGAKGPVKLSDILSLRRKEPAAAAHVSN